MDKHKLLRTLEGAKPTKKEYRSQNSLAEVEALVTASESVDIKKLRQKVLSCGVPDKLRATIWKLLLGYLPQKKSAWAPKLQEKRASYKKRADAYDKSLQSNTVEKRGILKDISVDVPRTFIDGYTQMCADTRVRAAVSRALYIWASTNEIAYYQGMMDLIYAILIVNLTDGTDVIHAKDMSTLVESAGGEEAFSSLLENAEADTFFCFDGLMKIIGVNALAHRIIT